MKSKLLPVYVIAAAIVIGCLIASHSETNQSVVRAQEMQAQINQHFFTEGVRCGLIASQRNPEVQDLNVLVQIAYSIFARQQALEQQRVAMQQQTNISLPTPAATNQVKSSNTNSAPTNATENVEEP